MTLYPASLRGRIVWLLLGLLTAAFAASASILVVVTRHVLTERLDDQLRAAGVRFSVSLEYGDNDADDRLAAVEGQVAGTLGARAKNGVVTAAAVVGTHDGTDAVSHDARARLAQLSPSTDARTVHLPGLGDYRLLVQPGRDQDVQITGLPAGPLEHTVDHLAVVVVIVFAGALTAVALGAGLLVRQTMRPLARMAATADTVAGLPLHAEASAVPQRVADSGAGREVDSLGRAFNAMLAQVDDALRTRARSEDQLRAFIADASHELRTPISVVRSSAELAERALREQTDDDTSADVTNALARITAQSEAMSRIVDDLLLLARLDAGRPLAREPVDIVRIALEAVDDARMTAPRHRWQLVLPDRPVWVLGDRQALAQVTANLLGNARAHTPAGTTVAVEVTADPPRVTVRDDGPGMPADLAPRAFDRFVHGSSAPRGSTGLGLPIVAAILKAHDTTAELDTGPEGTRISFVLTERPGRPPADGGAPRPSPGSVDTGHPGQDSGPGKPGA